MLQEFTYHAPQSRKELLARLSGDTRVLAGGTDLLVDVRSGKERPSALVDVKRIPGYRDITWREEEGLAIGAAVRCIDLIEHEEVRGRFPLLVKAAHNLGSPQIRNRATVVGNICTASPAADMAPPLLCLGAHVAIAGPGGERTLPLGEFLTGVKTTALKAGEIVERILVPAAMAGARGDVEKLKRIKGHDLALVSVAMVKSGKLLRLAVGACAPTPLVIGDFAPTASFDEVWQRVERALSPIDDVRASREFRVFMVKTFVKRLMERLGS